MITAQEYFTQYLSWKRRAPGKSPNKKNEKCYDSYTGMDVDMLMHDAESERPAAMEELGERYLFGVSPLDKDVEEATRLLEAAAEAGHPDAMHLLANMHLTDDYGCKDLDLYFKKLQAAASRGSWRSMYNLALAYYKGKEAYEGHGVEKDPAQCYAWGMQCQKMTMDLLTFYFTNPCTKNFDDYFEHVYDAFVQSVCASTKMLLVGDGIEKDIPKAIEILNYVEEFHQHFLNCECHQFMGMLNICNNALKKQGE